MLVPTLTLLSLLPYVFAQAPNGYACPTTCQAPACFCASTSIPGGLTPDQTPQFVTLTADDAIEPSSYDAFMEILKGFTNPNGCRLPVTWFVSTAWTDFGRVTRAKSLGDEIAAHTINHANLTQASPTLLSQEIGGSVSAIRAWGGISKRDLTGFRHPYLSFSPATLAEVHKLGFQYDSTATLDPTKLPYWPHTLDYGFPYQPQPCDGCPAGTEMKYPGLWEIPLYSLLTTAGAVWSSMDPIINPQLNDYDIALANLQHSFKVHYESKLPFGLYQHFAQLVAWGPEVQAKKIELFRKFIQWTQTEYKNVWYTTNQQLLQWMVKPTPVDKMVEFLPCTAPATMQGNEEICDGIDNDGDGQEDDGLMVTCQITPLDSFRSCYGCPSVVPNITNPVPAQTGERRIPIPDEGCEALGVWDPVKGVCVNLKRPEVKLPSGGDAPQGGSQGAGDKNKDKDSGAADLVVTASLGFVIVVAGLLLS
ncbi:hypothetical protein HDU85_006825 [Gaertneriomyces sp. JEL0708]|nr:hypothetical protein HDU85_006825 [Gaertneriomyces sp. JEL0708]